MKRKKIFLIILFIITIIRLITIFFLSDSKYEKLFLEKTNRLVKVREYPRGNITDINGNVLAYDEKIKVISFTNDNHSVQNKIKIAEKLSEIIFLDDTISVLNLKKYYLLKYNPSDLITTGEKTLFEERKISNEKYYELKINRITEEDLEIINKKEALIYTLMNEGYNYEKKIIKDNAVSDKEFALVNELDLNGVNAEYIYKRKYPEGNTLRSILGTVALVPHEEKEYYLNHGYNLNDMVGVSFLEKYYENYLTSTPSIYKIVNNKMILISEGAKGNDLKLNIDLNIQKQIDEVLIKEIAKAKKEKNTDYFDHSYVIVSNKKGELVAISSKRLVGNTFIDNADNVILSAYTMGSVVKAASSSVNYYYNLIDEDSNIIDGCVKLFGVPAKCSYTSLGKINSISALAHSSNYYQFITAIKLLNKEYQFNMKLNVIQNDFNIYRDMFKNYGLGTKTYIDLPGEKTGIEGKIIADDLFLNFTIGQYDNYTIAGLTQYINTLANNGERIALSLMNEITSGNKVILKNKYKILTSPVLEEKDYIALKEGMKNVFIYGTGRGAINKRYNVAGKTGTSESFLGDVKTITKTLALYAPSDEPVYTIVVVSPNISYDNEDLSYTSNINYRISREVLKILFEK